MVYVVVLLMYGVLLAHANTDPPPYQIDPKLLKSNVNTATSYPGGIDYIGVGYNLLYANPDGSPMTAAQDPGLRPTWRVFDWTFDDGSKPDQIEYMKIASCSSVQQLELFHNAYAYASKFEHDVSFSANVRFRYGSTKFSHSNYYKDVSTIMQSNSYIYYEEKNLCNLGEARFKSELAQVDQYPLARSFVHRVNSLPATYSQATHYSYMTFIHDFGTHVLSKTFLGTKEVKRYQWSSSAFASYSAEHYSSSTSLGGSFMGFKSSIAVNTDSVKISMDTGFSAGLQVETYTLGDSNLAMPYAYTLMGMEEVFQAKFWQLHQDYVDDGLLAGDFYARLPTMRSNIELALMDYPVWLKSDDANKEPIVTVPITWPTGAFGLPMTASGCPLTNGFTFNTGWRYHDCEDDDNDNYVSSPNHFVANSVSRDIYQYFCMKTQNTVTIYDGDWPKGQYCVFHPSSGSCPFGMASGSIHWDDEDDDNKNRHSGSLPRGYYDGNTLIYYCCKIDGFAENAVYLPTDSPFYLFPYTNICQKVEGMNAKMEYIRWDDQDRGNHDTTSGWIPYKHGSDDYKIFYCYYTPT